MDPQPQSPLTLAVFIHAINAALAPVMTAASASATGVLYSLERRWIVVAFCYSAYCFSKCSLEHFPPNDPKSPSWSPYLQDVHSSGRSPSGMPIAPSHKPLMPLRIISRDSSTEPCQSCLSKTDCSGFIREEAQYRIILFNFALLRPQVAGMRLLFSPLSDRGWIQIFDGRWQSMMAPWGLRVSS